MPEGTEGQPEQGQPGEGQQTPPTTPAQDSPKPEAKFTQEEVDAIIAKRLARAIPPDYEDIKAKAEKFDQFEAGQKTDLQKALDKAAKAEARTTEVEARANQTLKRAAILSEAAKQNSTDPDVVAALLSGSDEITITDDKVEGAAAAVKALLKEKPYLVKGSSGASGGEFGGNQQGSIGDKIAAAEKAGDYDEVLRLKLTQATTGV